MADFPQAVESVQALFREHAEEGEEEMGWLLSSERSREAERSHLAPLASFRARWTLRGGSPSRGVRASARSGRLPRWRKSSDPSSQRESRAMACGPKELAGLGLASAGRG